MSEHSSLRPKLPRFDFEAGIVIFFALVLVTVGLVVQTSAGQYLRESMRLPHDPFYTFRMQLFYLVPAIFACVFFARTNLERLRKYTWHILAGACVLLVCARFAIPGVSFCGATFPGVKVNGAWRWINLGVLRLQASDPAKIALVFALAHYLAGAQRFFQREKIEWFDRSGRFPIPTRAAREDFLNGFLKPFLIIGAVCGLVALGPDLGTMVLCATVGIAMVFLAGGRLRYLVPVVSCVAALIPGVVYFWRSRGLGRALSAIDPALADQAEIFFTNRFARVLSFLDPEGTQEAEGHQLWQSLLGFGSGGTNGVGLGDGVQYRYFMPEAHTDFVFAVVGEEFGFVRSAVVALVFLGLFVVVWFRLRKIPDVFHFCLCFGAMFFIVLQAIINMCVVTGLLPTKGMSLPFISYGGSNLVVMFSFVGIIINSMRNWRKTVFPPPLVPVEMPEEKIATREKIS